MHQTITIDGPSGSGKSTVSRMLAEALGFLYLDTGAMYRAAALAAVRSSVHFDDGPALAALCTVIDLHFRNMDGVWRIHLGDEDVSDAIRTPGMDKASSQISAVREVRQALMVLQREIGRSASVVAEGRDMGTVVSPEARYKFFLEAPAETRALRRYLERQANGEEAELEEVVRAMKERDERDSTREIAPLKPAPGAVIIETARLTPSGVVSAMMEHMGLAAPGSAPGKQG